jgi:hypothetical protein
MYSETNEKLEYLSQGIARLHKVEAMTAQLESAKRNLSLKENEFKKILEKESLDVEKLENGSFAAAFLAFVQKLEGRIEKERAEMLAAKLKYDQAVKDIQDVNYHLSELSAERLKYAGFQKEYDTLLAQKKESLLRHNGETAQRILELTKEINKLKNRLKETREAILAGKEVLDCLSGILDSLKTAENWGTWDIFGGGMIASWEKHENVDYAMSQTERAQFLLRRFKTELVDVKIDSEICMDHIDGFSRFADFFFDNFITDMFIQKKIAASYQNVDTAYKQIANVIGNLEKLTVSDRESMDRLKEELSSLVKNA